jgi:hypothetical protein
MNLSRTFTLSGLLIVFSAFGCTSANDATLPTPQPAVAACHALLPPGLDAWVAKVEGVIESLPDAPGTSFAERSASYKLWRLHEDFEPYFGQMLDDAPAIRNLGPGCVSKFDAAIQINRGLPIVGARIYLCSQKGDSNDPLTGIFTCLDPGKVKEDAAELIVKPLGAYNASFDGPTVEYLQGLRPWGLGHPNQDIYSAFSSFGKAFACQSYLNLIDNSATQFAYWLELLSWSWSNGSMPVDPETGMVMSVSDNSLPSQTTIWLSNGTPPTEVDLRTAADTFWTKVRNAEMLAVRGANFDALAPLSLNELCAGVMVVVDKIAGTPPSVGSPQTEYGQLDGLFDGLTKCGSGELGDEQQCRILRVFSAYPLILDSYIELELELRKLSDFELTTE